MPSDYPLSVEALQSSLSGTSWALEDSVDIILTQTLKPDANESVVVVERDWRIKSAMVTLDFNSAPSDRYMYALRTQNGLVYVLGDIAIERGHAGVHRLVLKAKGQQLHLASDNACRMHEAFHSGRPLSGALTSWSALGGADRAHPFDWEYDVYFSVESIALNTREDSKARGEGLKLYRGLSINRSDSTSLTSYVAHYIFNSNHPCHP